MTATAINAGTTAHAIATPTGFDSYTSEDATEIALHVYDDGGNADRTAAILNLTPARAVELIQELALALESIPGHALLGADIGILIETDEKAGA